MPARPKDQQIRLRMAQLESERGGDREDFQGTSTIPGSPERVEVYARRVGKGLPIDSSKDVNDDGRRGLKMRDGRVARPGDKGTNGAIIVEGAGAEIEIRRQIDAAHADSDNSWRAPPAARSSRGHENKMQRSEGSGAAPQQLHRNGRPPRRPGSWANQSKLNQIP